MLKSVVTELFAAQNSIINWRVVLWLFSTIFLPRTINSLAAVAKQNRTESERSWTMGWMDGGGPCQRKSDHYGGRDVNDWTNGITHFPPRENVHSSSSIEPASCALKATLLIGFLYEFRVAQPLPPARETIVLNERCIAQVSECTCVVRCDWKVPRRVVMDECERWGEIG